VTVKQHLQDWMISSVNHKVIVLKNMLRQIIDGFLVVIMR